MAKDTRADPIVALPPGITVASDAAYTLGEGPLWDAARQRVLWVDIDGRAVHVGSLADDRLVPAQTHTFESTVGAVAVSVSGELLVALDDRLAVIAADGSRVPGPIVLAGRSGRRLNDGKCDPAGRFLVGSLGRGGTAGGEVLVRCEENGALTVIDDDLSLSNGLGWSPDGRTMYSIDSVPGVLWQRSYDAATGVVGTRRELIRFADDTPDGMCVDAEGHLWVAMWGPGQVRRYTSAGERVATLELPAPHVTSVAFVGASLDRLLITSATADLSAADRARYPLSGHLFLADVGVVGVPLAAWSGFAATATARFG